MNRDPENKVTRRAPTLPVTEGAVPMRQPWLSGLFDSLPEVAPSTREHPETSLVSSDVERALDFTVEELSKNTADVLRERIHPDESDRFVKGIQALFTQGQPFDEKFRVQGKDGNWIWVHARAVPSHDEESVLFADGVPSDIVQRKQAEQSLQEQLSLMQAINTCAPDALLVEDVGGRLRFINHAGERLLGYSMAELMGKVMHDVCHYKRRDGTPLAKSECALAQATAAGKTLMSHEDVYIRKDGTPVDVLCSSACMYDGERTVGSVIVLHDNTSRKLAEQAHKSLQEQFLHAQKMEALGVLAGGVAHDFNNLLQVINGYSDLIVAECVSNPTILKRAQAVHDAGIRAARLTHQLLDFSRTDAGVARVIPLNSTLEELMKMVRTLVGADIDLTTRIRTDGQSVQITAGQLEQVVMNLVVNARDAMPKGGKLHIEVSCVSLNDETRKAFGYISTGPYVQLSVCDTGCGMSPQAMKHVFEPFFTTKEPGKGTGLGLSTVYGIVTQNGGGIRIDSMLGVGSTFHICLPVTKRHASMIEALKHPAPQRGTERILLAEDKEDVAALITCQLTRLGYSVVGASNGAEALRLAAASPHSFDLLITDTIMPKMGGHELTKKIRDICPTIKIVHMSGYHDTSEQHTDPKTDLPQLHKPFTIETLGAVVRQALDPGAARRKE